MRVMMMMLMIPEICRAEFGKLTGRCWRFHILNKLFGLAQSLCCLPIMMIMMMTMMIMMMTTLMTTTMMMMFNCLYKNVFCMFSIEPLYCITLQRCEISALLFEFRSFVRICTNKYINIAFTSHKNASNLSESARSLV